MQPLLIPCPECGKDLKLRDRSLLGRRGKCPQCEFRFVLQEPEEVELELADGNIPAVGTSARWVPDDPPETDPPATSIDAPSAVESAPRIQVSDPDAKPATGAARLGNRRQRQKSMRLWITIGSTVTGMILAVVVAMAFGPKNSRSGNSDGTQSTPESTGGNGAKKNSPPPSLLAEPALPPDPPPPGKPISLKFIPSGARMIIHLRPADIWQPNSQADKVLACLGPLGVWTEKTIKQTLLFEPKQIEEALLCLYLDDKTRPPELAYWVKFVEPVQKKSTFLEAFGGKRNDDFAVPIYVTDGTSPRPNRAYMISNRFGEGFASVPASMMGQMVESIKSPGLPHGGLEELLKHTDRNRHVTLIFNPRDLTDFKEHLFAKNLHDLLGQFVLRFDEDAIRAVAWSFHFGSPRYRDFYSEIVLRNTTSIDLRLLQVDMKRKFDRLPGDLTTALREMRPTMVSERKLVSRLPLMLQAFHVETVPFVPTGNERYIKLTTALPQVAGPNLAAAGMLAWRMSGRTDFTKPPPSTGGKKRPERIAERLKQRIEVDFRMLPLEEAFNYIGGETSVRIKMDGDGLKDAGYTRNLKQTLKLEDVPAIQVIAKILSQYQTPGKEMVVIDDDDNNLLLVTTKKFAQTVHKKKPLALP